MPRARVKPMQTTSGPDRVAASLGTASLTLLAAGRNRRSEERLAREARWWGHARWPPTS